MPNPIDPNATVGRLVAERPSRSRVFEQLGVDYCCGGKRTLGEACATLGLAPERVVSLLQAEGGQTPEPHSTDPADADQMTLAELVEHIQNTHHAYLRNELPRLDMLTAKVARAHGGTDPRLLEVHQVLREFAAELTSHMLKEERILFPLICAAERGQPTPGSVSGPIRQMEAEHDDAGRALAAMRHLTDGYQAPDGACNTYLAMLDALEYLEQDMHQHVHKENNILFPKAVAIESRAPTGAHGA